MLGKEEAHKLLIEALIAEMAIEIEWIGYLKGLRDRNPELKDKIDPIIKDIERLIGTIQEEIDGHRRRN